MFQKRVGIVPQHDISGRSKRGAVLPVQAAAQGFLPLVQLLTEKNTRMPQLSMKHAE